MLNIFDKDGIALQMNRCVYSLDSGPVSQAEGPAIPGVSGLQMEAVRLLNEDQVSPVPTTPLRPRPKSTMETCILSV